MYTTGGNSFSHCKTSQDEENKNRLQGRTLRSCNIWAGVWDTGSLLLETWTTYSYLWEEDSGQERQSLVCSKGKVSCCDQANTEVGGQWYKFGLVVDHQVIQSLINTHVLLWWKKDYRFLSIGMMCTNWSSHSDYYGFLRLNRWMGYNNAGNSEKKLLLWFMLEMVVVWSRVILAEVVSNTKIMGSSKFSNCWDVEIE